MTSHPLVAALNQTTAEAMRSDRPLAERLRMIADEVRAKSPEFAGAVDAFVGRLIGAEAGANAPQIGERLPSFMLPDQNGRLASMDAMLGQGPLVVAFLRGHWCPYCRITAGALGALAETARALGAGVVAITPESRPFAKRLDADSGGGLPILADLDNGYALSLNLAVWVDDDMAQLIAGAGWDIPAYHGNAAWVLPIPAAFVLDRTGVIAARYVNPDYRERASIDDLVAALRALG